MSSSEPVSVIPKDENLTRTERPDSIQDLQIRLVKNTTSNVSQLVSESGTQSDTEFVSQIPQHNVSLSQIFQKHNHRIKRSPWFEYVNSTHYLSRNATHGQ